MSRYRKIDQRIWNDEKFRALEHQIGLPGGDRTPDNLLRRQVLYPTELRADSGPDRAERRPEINLVCVFPLVRNRRCKEFSVSRSVVGLCACIP